MNDQEIAALAREYAEEIYPNLSDKIISLRTQEIKNAERLIRFLLRRYCLVEKEVVRTAYQQAMEQGKHAHVKCHVESRAKLRLLESLFPEIGKEVEG